MPAEKKLPAALWLVRNTKLGALLVQGLNAFSGLAARVAFKKPVSTEIRKAYTGPYDSWDNRIATLRFVQDIPLGDQRSRLQNRAGYRSAAGRILPENPACLPGARKILSLTCIF